MFVDSPQIPPPSSTAVPSKKLIPNAAGCAPVPWRLPCASLGRRTSPLIASRGGRGAWMRPGARGYFHDSSGDLRPLPTCFLSPMRSWTGWGRTGKLWASSIGGHADIIATAKGMTAGYTPLSAIIGPRRPVGSPPDEAFAFQSRGKP